MSTWEEVTDLLTGFDIPVRDIVFLHGFDEFVFEWFAGLILTDVFHDFEGKAIIDTHIDEVVHDIVTASDDIVELKVVLHDEVLGVVVPNVGTMGEAGDDEKVVEGMRLCLFDEALDEGRSEFWESNGTGLIGLSDELLSIGITRKLNAKGLIRAEKRKDFLIVHWDRLEVDASEVFHFTKGKRIDVAKLIEFEAAVVHAREFVVGC